MGRPHVNGPTPKFTLRLDAKVRRELEKQANGQHRTLGNLIHNILAEHAELLGATESDDSTMRKKINISIDMELHAAAKNHARAIHGTDFSGLVTKLIVEDLGEAYLRTHLSQTQEKMAQLQQRIAAQEKERLPDGPRGLRAIEVPPEKSRSTKPEAIAAKKAALAARKEVDGGRRKAASSHRS